MCSRRSALPVRSRGLLLALFALWACSPMMSGPPPVPLATPPEGARAWEHSGRMGAALSGATSVPRSELSHDQNGFGGSATLWIGRGLGEHGEIGGIANFAMLAELGYLGYFGSEVPVTPSGGLYLRKDLSKNSDTYLGISGSVGWLYGSVGAPMGWKLNDRVWLYTHPELGWDLAGVVQLPLGVTLENEAGTGRFTAEAGVHGPMDWSVVPYVSVGYEALR